ncbi:hypothetical protein AB1L30_19820 [Bremerella sp. JC817]|uniref:hypothetical protein n=1 Tax=Bremerella sp. JC817 TaxID=3231756 RepID=UPI003459FCBC
MLVFLLFSVVNLCVGFGAAVLLGYGPRPWYALFLPSGGDEVVQIDALDGEAESAEKAEAEEPQAPKPEPKKPPVVSHPFPEMNEPEDAPEPEPTPAPPSIEDVVSAAELESLTVEEEAEQPVAEVKDEPKVSAPPAAAAEAADDEEHELEDFLAGRREEPKNQEPTNEEASAVASADDIASMFASAQGSAGPKENDETKKESPAAAKAVANEPEEAESSEDAEAKAEEAEEDFEDKPLDQDDIAALFNS